MAWMDKLIKKVGKGEPIPQHFSDKIDDFEAIKGEDGASFVMVKNNIQIAGNTVQEYWEGSANITKTFATEMTGISIANDGLNDLTFTINGVTRTVYSGEPYNATLKPFTSITITASDKYRAEVLS